MESIIGVLEEIPTGETANVQVITGFQHNLIGSSAPALTGQRILTVEVVVQVLVKPKDTALEIGASGTSGEGDIAPAAAVNVFVGIDDHVQGGDIKSTIAILIVLVFAQTVFIQIDGSQFIKRYGDINNGVFVFVVNILSVIADGDVDFFPLRRKHGGGDKAQHHHQGEEQAEEFFHSHIGYILSLMFLLSFSSLSAFSSLPPPVPAAKGRDRP